MNQMTRYGQPLEGLRILVAEDEFLIAATIEDTLREAGADTSRAASVRAALADIDYKVPSAALLDVHLGPQTTEQVADDLAARNIPFVFYSGGRLPEQIRAKYPHAQILMKPVAPRAIVDALLRVAR